MTYKLDELAVGSLNDFIRNMYCENEAKILLKGVRKSRRFKHNMEMILESAKFRAAEELAKEIIKR